MIARAAIFAFVLGILQIDPAPGTSICIAGKKAALTRGGFSGPIICSTKNASFRRVGVTQGAGFEIFDYRYRFKAAVVWHGGHRIVVFRRGQYVGQYMVLAEVKVSVVGSSLRLRGEFGEPTEYDLSRSLPRSVLGDGENGELFR